jgi:hypothetical protein
MADTTSGRNLVAAAAVMFIAAQLLAIANDLFLRQSDPSDIVLLGVLIVLSVFLLRRARWARWTTVVLVAAGGLLELAGAVLLVAARTAPGFWSAVDRAIPALAGLRTPVAAFTASRAFPLLAGSVLISALLDLTAAGILAFAPSVRAYFAPDEASSRLGA